MALHELADSGLRGAGRTAAGDATFVFYSAHGRPVVDAAGNAIGRVDDLAVTLAERFPFVTALVVRRGVRPIRRALPRAGPRKRRWSPAAGARAPPGR